MEDMDSITNGVQDTQCIRRGCNTVQFSEDGLSGARNDKSKNF